ncbi:MAG: hypothetical protein WAP35_10595 [Solirubrobacterales bacterium]
MIALAFDSVSGGPALLVGGIVDSGADMTLLPKDLAYAIGLTDADLTQTKDGAGGAGDTHFDTWVAAQPLGARVFADTGDGQDVWGPKIELEPQFAEDTTPLYGRADFFSFFEVTFSQDVNLGNVFHLDY